MTKLIAFLLAAFALSSCTYAFEKNIRDSAEVDIPFTSVQSSIERDTGAVFIWGGVIVNSVFTGSGNFMEVVQTPVDKYGKIVNTHQSEGRFLVYSPSKLSPEDYRIGRLISVAGFLIRGAEAEVSGRPYTYPLLEAINISLWEDMEGEIPSAYFPPDTESIFPWTNPKR